MLSFVHRPASLASRLGGAARQPTRASTSSLLSSIATPSTRCSRLLPVLSAAPRRRAFSSSPALHAKTIKPHLLPKLVIPPYPYGERRMYKQSNKGLYGSARIRFGNSVAPRHNKKTRRFWKPNVHVKVFKCPSLPGPKGANVKTRLTLRVLKTIRREGGLENYLLKSKPRRLKDLGPAGWNLRWLIMQSKPVQERFNEERVKLGLEPKPIVDNDAIIQWALDHATPGPLNATNRETLAKLKEQRAAEEAIWDIGTDIYEDDSSSQQYEGKPPTLVEVKVDNKDLLKEQDARAAAKEKKEVDAFLARSAAKLNESAGKTPQP